MILWFVHPQVPMKKWRQLAIHLPAHLSIMRGVDLKVGSKVPVGIMELTPKGGPKIHKVVNPPMDLIEKEAKSPTAHFKEGTNKLSIGHQMPTKGRSKLQGKT